RIAHALNQKVSPCPDDRRAEPYNPGHPAGAAQRRPDLPKQILQHEPADTSAGIENRQNKQRLEHDGEVIAEAEDDIASPALRENMRHAKREGRRATSPAEERR